MEREEAIRRIKARFDRWALDDEDMKAIQTLIPELRESEDERIRKGLIEALKTSKTVGELKFVLPEPTREECIAYLEKQKEQSITANDLDEEIHRFFDECIEVHDAKIYGVDERVITVDCYEITARHFAKWGEKQKEQKPERFELKAGKWYICHRAFCARADHLTVKEGERFQCEKDGIVKGFVIKEPEKYFKECSAPEPMEKEQKQEWSDEDADMLNCCISSIEEAKENRYAYKETDGDTSYDREIDWLKSLRPQQKVEWCDEDEKHKQAIIDAIQIVMEECGDAESIEKYKDDIDWFENRFGNLRSHPHWKPSEDEVRLINTSISFLKDFADKGYENAVECIDWLKSKLNGNTCK